MEIKVNINESVLNKFCEDLVDEMLTEGSEMMKAELSRHISTGETIASLTSKRKGNRGEITVGGAAVWLEFGTGVANNPANHPMVGSVQGVKPIGTYGQGKGSDPKGWVYPKDGKFYHTKGIAQTRFMYNAGEELKRNAQEIASRVASKWNK